MKKILFFIFGYQSKSHKYFLVLKNSLIKIKKILPLVRNNKLKFIFKIIESENFVEFQPSLDIEKKYFTNNYQFNYEDWFSANMNIWKHHLKHLKEINYLEIGSFEGRSAVFVGELENVRELTCIDTFEGSIEQVNTDFDLVYKNCSENLKKLNKPHNLIQDTSHNFFKKNKKKFDVIYIDGSHHYKDVKKDFINSVNCLKNEGILICDDFLWFFYEKKEHNPIGAILECYDFFKKDLEIQFINYQIIFKKIFSTKNMPDN